MVDFEPCGVCMARPYRRFDGNCKGAEEEHLAGKPPRGGISEKHQQKQAHPQQTELRLSRMTRHAASHPSGITQGVRKIRVKNNQPRCPSVQSSCWSLWPDNNRSAGECRYTGSNSH